MFQTLLKEFSSCLGVRSRPSWTKMSQLLIFNMNGGIIYVLLPAASSSPGAPYRTMNVMDVQLVFG
jgi:hypothetical protein